MRTWRQWIAATLVSVAMIAGAVLAPSPVLASGPIPPTTAYRTVELVTKAVNITLNAYSGTRDPNWPRYVFSVYAPAVGWFVNGVPYRVGGQWFVRLSRWTPVLGYTPLVRRSDVRKACMYYQGVAWKYVPASCKPYLMQ